MREARGSVGLAQTVDMPVLGSVRGRGLRLRVLLGRDSRGLITSGVFRTSGSPFLRPSRYSAALPLSSLRNRRHPAQADEQVTPCSHPPTHPVQRHEHTRARGEQEHRVRLLADPKLEDADVRRVVSVPGADPVGQRWCYKLDVAQSHARAIVIARAVEDRREGARASNYRD